MSPNIQYQDQSYQEPVEPALSGTESSHEKCPVMPAVPDLVEADFFQNSDGSEPDLHDASGASIIEAGSILDQNGRMYQGYRAGKYFLPNDPAEQDRLDFQHAGITVLLNDRLSWAPFAKPPTKVLDVATGTGIWAIEFAQKYPYATVVGSDISAIQPEHKPANCLFVQEDSEEPWIHPKDYFDLIHLRLVCTCFDHPKTVIQYAYESLSPGGWIEFHDVFAGVLGADNTAVKKAFEFGVKGAAAMGRDIVTSPYYKQWLEEAGFVDVKEWKRPWPMNDWPDDPRLKTAGLYMQRMLMDNTRGMLYKMLQGNGLTNEEIEDLIKACKAEYSDRSIHAFWPFYVVCGRKPIVD